MISSQKLLKIKQVVNGRYQSEGDGATVMRLIGSQNLPRLDPFLMLDHGKVRLPAGFPDHPHRGFETITYVLKGKAEHEDFLGNHGVMGPGDVQWMTAGKGIVHAEMPFSHKEDTEVMQLWVNLPKKEKMCEPRYQYLNDTNVVKAEKDGVKVRIFAGKSLGIESPSFVKTPITYLMVEMQENQTFQQLVDQYWNSGIYLIEGKIKANGKSINAQDFIVFEDDKSGAAEINVDCLQNGTTFLLLAGKPLNEPIYQRGPFVLASESDLYQTFDDYNYYKNGFEQRKGWKSQIQNKKYDQQKFSDNTINEL